MHRATGSVLNTACAVTLLAEACNRLGRTTEGLSYLTEAEQIIETTNDACHKAELHRVRGDLLNANGDVGGAELSYQQAVEIAMCQSAKMFRASRIHQPFPDLARSGQAGGGSRASRAGLRLVH
jgi:hypothetical protein